MQKLFKLRNGIQVATYNLPSLRSLHLRVIVKGGSLAEDKKHNGVAHFMEHLLVQGTPSLPNAEEFSGYIESLAGSYSAYTERLLVGFNITLPATRLEDAVKIASEAMFESLFVEAAIEKERRAVLEELREHMDSHMYKISKNFRETRFKNNHPLTFDSGGSISAVKKAKKENLLEYWHRFFVPRNTYVLVSGKFEESELNRLLEQYFGKYNQGNGFPGYPKMSPDDLSDREVIIKTDPKLKANYIDLTFPALTMDDPIESRLAQNIAFIILGGIRNSRLFRLLRYQRGLVYSVNAGARTLPGLGYGFITSEVSAENLEEVVTLISSVLESFIENGPTQNELDFVKNFLSNQWMMAFDHPSAIAGWIENDLLWNNMIRLPEDYVDMIKDITIDDLRSLMQTRWDMSKLNLLIQGPVKHTKANTDKYSAIVGSL